MTEAVGSSSEMPRRPWFAEEVKGLIARAGNHNGGASSSYDVKVGYDGRVAYGDRYQTHEFLLRDAAVEVAYREFSGNPTYDCVALQVYTYAGSVITRRRTYMQRNDFAVTLQDRTGFPNSPVTHPICLDEGQTRRVMEFTHELSERKPDELLLKMLED